MIHSESLSDKSLVGSSPMSGAPERVVGERAGQCGVVYVATGARFIAEAVESSKSIRRTMPGLPIALFSDQPPPAGVFDYEFEMKDPQGSFIDKILPLANSPFSRTLFLDTDTLVVKPCWDLFEVLDHFDLAVAHEPGRLQYSIYMVPDAFVELNTGVIAYRNTAAVNRFFRTWLRLYGRDCRRNLRENRRPHDQVCFTQVLYRSVLRFCVLSPEYNFRSVFPQSLAGEVRIVHGRNSGLIHVPTLNRRTVPRMFCPNPKDWVRGLVMSWRLLYHRLARGKSSKSL